MTIRLIESLAELAAICAQLVRQGITFDAKKDETTKTWTITMTGGF